MSSPANSIAQMMNERIDPAQIPGWFDWGNWAKDIISSLPDGALYIEIGCFLGKSTTAIAQMIQRSGRNIRLHAVDTFTLHPATAEAALLAHVPAKSGCNPKIARKFRDHFELNLRLTGTADSVEIIQKTSTSASKGYPDGTADVIFIDADHSYEAVCADIAAWWRVLKPGGIMAGHDIHTYQSVHRAVHDSFARIGINPYIISEQNIWTARKPLEKDLDQMARAEFREPVNFAPVILTCPSRENSLKETLESWHSTDFCGQQVLVKEDQTAFPTAQQRQEHNALAAIQSVLTEFPEADFMIFCEDDIIFNQHLRHNLEHWKPLRAAMIAKRLTGQPDFFFSSLYDCIIREIRRCDSDYYFVADPTAVYGSQCFVVSIPLARYFAEHWWEVPGMQDIKMSRLAARFCPIYYHAPSLVQHVGVVSAWGGGFHQTKNFDRYFKAM